MAEIKRTIVTYRKGGGGKVVIEIPVRAKMKDPSYKTMMKWVEEGRAKATDGCWVEPDGRCPHGYASWLLELGLS